jgi:acyl-CoA synthetase (AMP-forming)/AMP-acid ligase II
VGILAPQGVDYVVGLFAAISAGTIALPLFAPKLPGHWITLAAQGPGRRADEVFEFQGGPRPTLDDSA